MFLLLELLDSFSQRNTKQKPFADKVLFVLCGLPFMTLCKF